MIALALALLLAQAKPPPPGAALPLSAGLDLTGGVYQLGPVGNPSLLWLPATPAASSVDSSTLALWHMDETDGGPPVDSAGYDGGITSSAFYGTVQAGVGVYSGDRYFAGNSSSGSPSGACTSGAMPPGTLQVLLTGDYTWSAWLYRGTSPATQAYENPIILSDGAVNYGVTFGLSVNNSTNKMEFYWKIGSSSYESHASSASLPTGGWHHVAATVSVAGGGATRTVAIYLDGALDSTVTGWVKPYVGITTQIAYIGCAESGYYAWAGGIDDMLIQSRALTAAEVLALYRQSGRWSSPPPSKFGPSLALSRASAATYETAAGHIVNALSGELRVGYQGAVLEPSRTNQVLRSSELGHAAWTSAGITVTADSVAAPDGTSSADTLTVSAGPGSLYQITSASSGAYTGSVWVKPGTSSTVGLDVGCVGNTATTCTCRTSRGDSCSVNNISANCIATASLGSSGWTRFEVTATCPALTSSVAMSLGPDAFVGSVGKTAYFWGAQMEAGGYATSYIPTTTTAVTRAADVLSVADSVLGSGSASIHLVLTPEWASSVDATLLASTTPNELGLATVSGTLDWLVGGNDIATGTLGWSAGTAQTVDAWYSPGGAWRVTDGTHAASGVSAATPSTGGTLYLGGSSSAGAGVAISQIKVCKRAGVCR